MIDIEKINNIQSDINEKIVNISHDFKELNALVNSLTAATAERDRACIKRNPYIVKTVIKHIANGMCKHDAIILTANELNEPIKRVEVLFWQQKTYMCALHLFSKKYTAEKMKAAGYPAGRIAAVLGVSENHVYKLLKSVPNEWILSNF